MAYLDQAIDINELPEDTGGGDFTPLPDGEYSVIIKQAEVKTTNDGTGQYIKLRLDVTGPTHVGRAVFPMVSIRNKSQQAESIGRGQLRSIMEALSISSLQDTDQLIGGPLVVKLVVKPARTDQATGKTYEAGNEVKAYKPAGAPVAAKPTFAAAPPAAAPAKAAPPWAKK